MPAPFAVLLGFALGVGFALVGRYELARTDEPLPRTRGFAVASLYGVLLWGPVAAYFLVFHGDWAYVYAMPWRRVPSAVDLAVVLAVTASVPSGFVVAAPYVRMRAFRALALLAGVPVTIAAGAAVACASRLRTSGTFAQYHGRFGLEPIHLSTLGKGVVWMGLVLALGVIVSVQILRRRGRRSLLG